MKSIGIICEYNPFHNGHKALIDKVKELYPDKKIICFMSGEFVQRGEVATLSSYSRAKAAVLCGADAVFKLPSAFCLAPAQIYAQKAVELIAATGLCDLIAFGSESGKRQALIKTSKRLYSQELEDEVSKHLKDNSYPKAKQIAYSNLFGEETYPLTPNDILAVEYIQALERTDMDFVLIKREEGENICSASSIRKRIKTGEGVEEYIPTSAYEVLEKEVSGGAVRKEENYEKQFLMSLVNVNTAYADVPKDFVCRIRNCAGQAQSLKEYYELLSVKHYTKARLHRMSLCSVLGIKQEEWEQKPPYIQLVALRSDAGASIKKSSIAILTKCADIVKLGKEATEYFEKEARRELFAYSGQDKTVSLAHLYRETPFIL